MNFLPQHDRYALYILGFMLQTRYLGKPLQCTSAYNVFYAYDFMCILILMHHVYMIFQAVYKQLFVKYFGIHVSQTGTFIEFQYCVNLFNFNQFTVDCIIEVFAVDYLTC